MDQAVYSAQFRHGWRQGSTPRCHRSQSTCEVKTPGFIPRKDVRRRVAKLATSSKTMTFHRLSEFRSVGGRGQEIEEMTMTRIRWIGWLLAGFLLLQNAAPGLTAPTGTDPLEGHVLQHSNGSAYVYHNGLKFAVQLANVGDAVIDVIPLAPPDQ